MGDDRRSLSRRTALQTIGLTLGATSLGGAAYAATSSASTGSAPDGSTPTPESGQPSPPWTRPYGTSDDDTLNTVVATEDGDLVVGGHTDTGGQHSWLFSIDAESGDRQWNRVYERDDDWLYGRLEAVIRTADGGFAVSGAARDAGGSNSIMVSKTDAEGNPQWVERYGGGMEGADLVQTGDGGFLVASGYGTPVVVRTDASGEEQWTTKLPAESAGSPMLQAMAPAHDGGCVVTGRTATDGDDDVYLARVTRDGDVAWRRRFDYSSADLGNDVVRTADGYAIAGRACTGGTTGKKGLLLHVDADGREGWSQTYGGTGDDEFNALTTTDDGGYFVGGPRSDAGFWMVKTAADGSELWTETRDPGETAELSDVAQTPAGDHVAVGIALQDDGAGPGPSDGIVVNLGTPE